MKNRLKSTATFISCALVLCLCLRLELVRCAQVYPKPDERVEGTADVMSFSFIVTPLTLSLCHVINDEFELVMHQILQITKLGTVLN